MEPSRVSSFLCRHLLTCVCIWSLIAATTLLLPSTSQAQFKKNPPKNQKTAPPQQPTTTPSSNGSRRVMLVLDASGSMWGKVQGRPKIEIAREVVRDFVNTLPADLELGLVVYGHRSKSDCNDIELLIPVGRLDRNRFIKTVNALQPVGMTPLTAAVEFAAEAMRYTEQEATVILVTDGEETCDRDPAAAALKLKALGLNFTTHVIAFDLEAKATRSIESFATTTGGRFLRADNATSLTDALFIAIESSARSAVAPEKEQPEGAATLTVPASAVAGSQVSISWSGPGNSGDYIAFAPAGLAKLSFNYSYSNYTYTRQGNPLEVTGLIEPGKAEVRYISGSSGKILGRASIVFIAAEHSLTVASSALSGTTINVQWTGANNQGDYITMVPKGSADSYYASYVYTERGNPVQFQAPAETGAWEIRYISAQGKIMARRAITIAQGSATLSAPESAIAGSLISIDWTGPNTGGDYITIVKKGTPDSTYGQYVYTAQGSPVKLTALLEAGPAEIRYATGQNKVLARHNIIIREGLVTLDAPAVAPAGKPVSIEWTGPNNGGDYITIVPKGTPESSYLRYAYTASGSPVKVDSPFEPGDMEIRYMSGQNKVLGRRALVTTLAPVTLKAPASAAAGSTVYVQWTGPNNSGDYITIVTKDTRDGAYGNYRYTSTGASLDIVVPDTPGPGEVRYMTGQGDKVVGRIPIKILPKR